MINIVKKYLRRKIHELNTLIGTCDDSSPQAQNKYIVKYRRLRKKPLVAASALSLSIAYKTSIFSEINPIAQSFFHLKSFLWKGLLTGKIRKKNHRLDFGLHQFLF